MGGRPKSYTEQQCQVSQMLRDQGACEDDIWVFATIQLWRSIVVGQVEVDDAEVERAAQNGPLGLDGPVIIEVLPQPEGDLGQLYPAAPAAAVGHGLVTAGGSEIRHGVESFTPWQSGQRRWCTRPAAGGAGWLAGCERCLGTPQRMQ